MGIVYVQKVLPRTTANNQILVVFSESVTSATAEVTNNYTFTPSLTITLASIVIGTGNTQVLLTCSNAIPKDVYYLQVQNVQDSGTLTPISGNNQLGVLNYYQTNSIQANISIFPGNGILIRKINFFSGQTPDYISTTPTSIFGATIITPTPTYINVSFNADLAPLSLSAAIASNWAFTTLSSIQIQAISVSIRSSNTVRIFITEAKSGSTHTLHLPINGLVSTQGVVYNGVPSLSFIATATSPTISMVQSINRTSLRVIFSEPVIEADALLTSNYSVMPPLTIISAQKETQNTYILETSAQTPLQSYTLTISNVRDASQNPI